MKNVNINTFSFLSWNVNGLLSKLKDNDFVSFVSTFDFVCLLETFADSFESDLFSTYKIFCKSALKLSKQGRRSGGIVCLVKNRMLPFVKQLDVNCYNCFVFLLDKKLFRTVKDVIYVCVYIPPERSPFYAQFDLE